MTCWKNCECFCFHSSLSILLWLSSHTFLYCHLLLKEKLHLDIGVFLNTQIGWRCVCRLKCFLSCYHLQLCCFCTWTCLCKRIMAASTLTLQWPLSLQVWLLPCLWYSVWGRDEGPWQQLHIVGDLMNEGGIKMVNHELWAFLWELYFRALCPSCFHALLSATGLVFPPEMRLLSWPKEMFDVTTAIYAGVLDYSTRVFSPPW